MAPTKPKKKAVVAAAPPKDMEERTIIVLKGIQFDDSPLPDVQARMAKSKLTLTVDSSGDNAEYFSKEQSIKFKIKVLYTKKELKDNMQLSDLHVIYGGHARYGRGACFGYDIAPGEMWDKGETNDLNGLYRLAYSYVPIPITDILHHGYTYNPVATTVPLNDAKMLKGERHPDLEGGLGKLHKTTINKLIAQLEAEKKWSTIAGEFDTTGDPLVEAKKHLRTKIEAGMNADSEIWYFDGFNFAEGKSALQLPLHAGWKDTINTPYELDKTSLKCRVFCHFGCDSFHHFQPVVRQNKGWQQVGNEGYAFFTTSAAYDELVQIWLYHILTYNVYNAKKSWDPSLKYVLNKTNTDLQNMGRKYQVI